MSSFRGQAMGAVLNPLQDDPAAMLTLLRQKIPTITISVHDVAHAHELDHVQVITKEEIEELIARRTEARKNKDLARADAIRKELAREFCWKIRRKERFGG